MPTWTDLLQWDATPLDSAAHNLRAHAQTIRTSGWDLHDLIPGEGEWSGETANAARSELGGLSEGLDGFADHVQRLANRVDSAADTVRKVCALVGEAQDFATANGLYIHSDGAVAQVAAGIGITSVGVGSPQPGVPGGAPQLATCASLVSKACEAAASLTATIGANAWFQGLRSFTTDMISTLLQGQAADKIAGGLTDLIRSHNPLLEGAALTTWGTQVDIGIPLISGDAIRSAGKSASVGIGAALDFSMQLDAVNRGEQSMGDAVVKTTVHTGISLGASVVAGATIGSVAGPVGTIGGALVGAAISVLGCSTFDKIYDSFGGLEGIGDAVVGLFR